MHVGSREEGPQNLQETLIDPRPQAKVALMQREVRSDEGTVKVSS